MKLVRIIGLKANVKVVLSALQNRKCIQIENADLIPGHDLESFQLKEKHHAALEVYSTTEAKITGILDSFPKNSLGLNSHIKEDGISIQIIQQKIDEFSSINLETNRRKKELQSENNLIMQYLKLVDKIHKEFSRKIKSSAFSIIALSVEPGAINLNKELLNELKKVAGKDLRIFPFTFANKIKGTLLAIPKSLSEQSLQILKSFQIPIGVLPEEYTNLSLDDAKEKIEADFKNNKEELIVINEKETNIAEEWAPQLIAWKSFCERELEILDSLPLLAETETTFVLYGWIEEEKVPSIKKELKKFLEKENLILEVCEIPKNLQKKIPVSMHNISILEPFTQLIKMRAIPNYEDLDPSFWMFLFLPVFFGMMVGDIGYGIMLFLLSLFGRKKVTLGLFGILMPVLMVGSIWSIIFGFLYGEFFGNLAEKIGLKPLWIDRASANNLNKLLYVAVAIGAVHIFLGLVLGVYNAIQHKDRKHLLERGGMLIGLIGIFLVICVLLNLMPEWMNIIAYSLIVVGIIGIAVSVGIYGIIVGPIEFVGMLGNILSYLRLAAVGLASVYLANVANMMVGSMGNIFLGFLLTVVIHALNIVLAGFSPMIHSLRLHYVEFMRKFFEGGQREFRPFGYSKMVEDKK